MPTEASLTKKFLDHARMLYPGLYALKINLMTRAGESDALICYHGRACFVECKKDKYDMTELQLLRAREIEHSGIPVWLVRFCNGTTEVCRATGEEFFTTTVTATAIRHIVEPRS